MTGDQAGRSVAPEVGAAVAMRATPGAYAVLLGSGMSRASGVPTGYEVLVDLCRQVAHASGDAEKAEADPLSWFAATTGAEVSYDNVLASLTGSREERVGILRRYFEPSPDEAEQGLKIPSAGHLALARLVQAGLVRVVLTTNFDRLIERALDQAGATYVVTATPEAVAGAMPLHLQDCQVVKLHGDYLDPGMLNTPEELSHYEPAVDKLLDRILDEYGLITIGWSAIYDPALRHAIERANVPANAPHSFTNASGRPSRLLCMCAPAGQEEFFTLVGEPVATRTEAPPPLSPDAQAAFIARSGSLAPQFKTELLPPPGPG